MIYQQTGQPRRHGQISETPTSQRVNQEGTDRSWTDLSLKSEIEFEIKKKKPKIS